MKTREDTAQKNGADNHTPEPWRVAPGADYQSGLTVDAGARGYVCDTGLGDEPLANARRIVACVNACAGIPTEKLTPEVFNVLSLAIRARLYAGHNGSCEYEKYPSYRCTCGHDALGEAYEASGLMGEP